MSAQLKEKSNELTIYPQKKYKPGRLLNPHKDHRLAMAFTILGLKLGCSVKDIECKNKSYPGFVRDLKSVFYSINIAGLNGLA